MFQSIQSNLEIFLCLRNILPNWNTPWGQLFRDLQSDDLGNIFYLGGERGRNEVYEFITTTNTTRAAATVPYNVAKSISIKRDDSVFILGGFKKGSYSPLAWKL